MRKRILAFVMLFLANGSLAWAQSADDKSVLPPAIPKPEHPATQEHPAAKEHAEPEARRPFSIFPFKKEEHHLPESAEEAEHHEEHKPQRLWVRAEYMIWWMKVANFPVLVTTGDPSDPLPGALSSLNTTILFGGTGIDFFDRKGGRFSAGWWFDDEQRIGIEASYFFLGGRSRYQTFMSDAVVGLPVTTLYPVLATPFNNTNTGAPDASLITFPGVLTGQVVVDAPTFFQGVEANMSATVWQSEKCRLEALGGFRHLNLGETLRIDSISKVDLAPQYVALGVTVPFNGNTITVSDRFEGRSYFYGGQIGARAETHWKRFVFTGTGKLAMGASHEVVTIRGSTSIDTQPVTNQNGGLYALSSNEGIHTRNVFAVAPEASFNLSYKLTEHIRLSAGYTFIYWSNVARPGDQIDTNINPNLVPTSTTFGAAGGPIRPAFTFRSTDFFAHGVNLGLEIRY